MKWSYASIGVIMLGLFGLAALFLFNEITTVNEQDYYNLKEITEAAMTESIDLAYFRKTGNIKMIQEKFVENFTRRFAEVSTFGTNDYTIEFYDIMEVPPKVTVVVKAGTNTYHVYGNAQDYDIVNELSAILEYERKEEK